MQDITSFISDYYIYLIISILGSFLFIIIKYFKKRLVKSDPQDDRLKKTVVKSDPQDDRLLQHIRMNNQYLESTRNSLESLINRKIETHIETFTKSLIEAAENYKNISLYAMQLDIKNISPLLKICNHQYLILLIKKQLKSMATSIENDFSALNKIMQKPYDIHDSDENLKYILANLVPITGLYEVELKRLKQIEIKLVKTESEFLELKNPGVFRKIKRLFSDKDKNRISEISKIWKSYYNKWNKLQSLIQDSEIRIILENYFRKLFIYTPMEHLNREMLMKQKQIKQITEDIEEGVISL